MQLIVSANKETGNESMVNMDSPSLKTYSIWSFGFTLSQMSALASAVYSIANSQKLRSFFREMTTIDIVCEIAEQAVMLIIMCNICIFLIFVGAEKLGLYNIGRYDNKFINGKKQKKDH